MQLRNGWDAAETLDVSAAEWAAGTAKARPGSKECINGWAVGEMETRLWCVTEIICKTTLVAQGVNLHYAQKVTVHLIQR